MWNNENAARFSSFFFFFQNQKSELTSPSLYFQEPPFAAVTDPILLGYVYLW